MKYWTAALKRNVLSPRLVELAWIYICKKTKCVLPNNSWFALLNTWVSVMGAPSGRLETCTLLLHWRCQTNPETSVVTFWEKLEFRANGFLHSAGSLNAMLLLRECNFPMKTRLALLKDVLCSKQGLYSWLRLPIWHHQNPRLRHIIQLFVSLCYYCVLSL